MAKKDGKKLALSIIVGVFIAIMVITLVNLIVSYAYEGPKYEDYCKLGYGSTYPVKYGYDLYGNPSANCTFSKNLQNLTDQCYSTQGQPVYEYNDQGCTIALKECSMCNKEFNSAQEKYNTNTFYIFAVVGFILIVAGLFIDVLLIQIISLPAGAVLVIEAAVKNFNNKLYVIITFSLLIIAAIYLALKKLR
jgi:hypothetical protein